jgi:NADH:ubiquinone oxidoreductase subunit E
MKTIRVCNGRVCQDCGAEQIKDTLQQTYQINSQTAQDVDLDFCGCVGYCELAPCVVVNDQFLIDNVSASTVVDRINSNDGRDLKKLSWEEVGKGDILGDLF